MLPPAPLGPAADGSPTSSKPPSSHLLSQWCDLWEKKAKQHPKQAAREKGKSRQGGKPAAAAASKKGKPARAPKRANKISSFYFDLLEERRQAEKDRFNASLKK